MGDLRQADAWRLAGFFREPKDRSGSHLPALGAAVLGTEGPIIELGMGRHSTPALHQVAERQRRLVFSFENKIDYMRPWRDMRSKYHRIALVQDWESCPYDLMFWGVAFVDQSPGAARLPALLELAQRAEIVVAHDSEPEEADCYKYDAAYPSYTSVRQCHGSCWTAVLSNYHDLSTWRLPE